VNRRARTVLRLIVVAAVFGATLSVLKGNDVGLRDDIGNLSAPWLLLPFFAGAAIDRRGLAPAAAGLLATVIALVAFYIANGFVLDLGDHSLLTRLHLTLAASSYWIARGLLTGPVFGALGGLWRRRGFPIVGVAVILLLDAEPPFWAFVHSGGGIAAFDFHPSLAASVVEVLVGLALAAGLAGVLSRNQRRAAVSGSK